MWGALLACTAIVLAQLAVHLRQTRKIKKRLLQAEEDVRVVSEERRSERAGRTKAEREVRELQLRLGQLAASDLPGGEDPVDLQRVAFPMRPIGILRSCFGKRNGTPRQPLLVPAARATITLRPDLSADFLEGLQQYSHCWVLYVFHMNTDLQRLWQDREGRGGGTGGVKGKIRVPRLDGGRLGVFATRAPHRPCPIGLSIAEVLRVDGRTLVLGGADIVNGSPVLDIKPYVPFCDAVPGAAAPQWVAARAEEEPLEVGRLCIPEGVDAQLRACWAGVAAGSGGSLYGSYQEFRKLVEQVLSRDIRSVTQRLKVPVKVQQGRAGVTLQYGASGAPAAPSPSSQGQAGGSGSGAGSADGGGEGIFHVDLDGVHIRYDVVEGERAVVLRSAAVGGR